MGECGLQHVEFGSESLSDPVLAAYGKPFHRDDIFIAHDQVQQAGLHVAHYFLFGGPGENADTLDRNLERYGANGNTLLSLYSAACGSIPIPPCMIWPSPKDQIRADQEIIEPVYYQSPEIGSRTIMDSIQRAARERPNWVIGAGNETMAAIMTRMYRRGFSGPLWEHLCRFN